MTHSPHNSLKHAIRRLIVATKRILVPRKVTTVLLGTTLFGVVAALIGVTLRSEFVNLFGLGLTAASLALGLLLAKMQGKQLTNQGEDLKTLAREIHKSLFNEVTLRIFTSIQENDKLSQRMHKEDRAVKQTLGAALTSLLLKKGQTNFFEEFIASRNVFIESGSTYAYLSLTLNDYFRNYWKPEPPRRIVSTNNILVFMVLVFQWRCRARLYPGTPAGQYGATYGTGYVTRSSDPDDPEFLGIAKDEMEHFLTGRAVATVAKKSMTNDRGPSRFATEVALLAVSKLHLSDGPHVGSLENVCFKHALLNFCRENQVPALLVIDSTKIETKYVKVGDKCRMLYPVSSDVYWDGNEDAKKRSKNLENVGRVEGQAHNGFDHFADDIAAGQLFLFVGYHRTATKPSEIVELEKRCREYNDGPSDSGQRRKLAWKTEQTGEVDMLVVYAAETIVAEQNKSAVAVQIQCAIHTGVFTRV